MADADARQRSVAMAADAESSEQQVEKIQEQAQSAEANVRASLVQAATVSATAVAMNANDQVQLEEILEEQANAQIVAVLALEENRVIIQELEEEYNDNMDEVEASFSPDTIRRDYNALTIMARIVLVLTILILACGLGWMGWQFISFLWPHLLTFIREYGPYIAGSWGSFLESWTRHPIVTSVNDQVRVLNKESAGANITGSQASDTLTLSGSAVVLQIIQLFFTYLAHRRERNLKDKAK